MNQFRAGVITPSQADALNDLDRRLRAVESASAGSLPTVNVGGRQLPYDPNPPKWLGEITAGADPSGYYSARTIAYGRGGAIETVAGGRTWAPSTAPLISYNEFDLGPGDLVEIQQVGYLSSGLALYIATLLGVGSGGGSGSGDSVGYVSDICAEFTEVTLSLLAGVGGVTGEMLAPVSTISSDTDVDYTYQVASDTNSPSLTMTRRRASDANVSNGDTVGQLRFLERVGGVDLELTRIEAIASGGVAFSEIRMYASTDSDTLAEVARFSTEDIRFPGLNSPTGEKRVVATDSAGSLEPAEAPDARSYLGIASGDITANTTVNSATFANVAGASFAVGASESWTARFVLAITGNTNGLRFQLAGPASPTNVTMICHGNTTGVAAFGTEIETAFSAPTGGTAAFASTTSAENLVIIDVKVINGANAGTVQLQAATVSGTNSSTIQGNRCWFNAQRIN